MKSAKPLKPHVKSGISFGLTMGVCYVASNLLFSAYPDGQQHVARALIIGLSGGVFAGLLFGWFIGKFSDSSFVKNATNIEMAPGENVLMQGPANHFKGLEAVGGKLYMTDRRLVFKSHKLNIQNHTLEIFARNIIRVEKYKPLGITHNGLLIMTSTSKEKFVVNRVEDWLEVIENSYLRTSIV